MNETAQKTKVTENQLYDYLTAHKLKLVRLAKLADIKDDAFNSCFRHHKNNNGVPRHFNSEQVKRINAALPLMADMLRQCVLEFDDSRAEVNYRGVAYDKALVEPMKQIGELMNLTAMVERVLGWSKKKKEAVLVTPANTSYGHITRDDVNRVNTELLGIAGVLSGYELTVYGDGGQTASMTAITPTETAPKKRGRRPRAIADVDDGASKPWTDTSLPLAERARLYKQQRPQGVLIFRANGGYAVAGDDALYVASLDATIHIDTETDSGYTTALMNEKQYRSVLQQLFANGRKVAFTAMYA